MIAEQKLARIAYFDELAAQWQSEDCSELRRHFAASYRRLVGVHPEKRDTFKKVLERIRDGGGANVADVTAQLNGDSSAGTREATS